MSAQPVEKSVSRQSNQQQSNVIEKPSPGEKPRLGPAVIEPPKLPANRRIGMRGYLRLGRIFLSFAALGVRILVAHRPWPKPVISKSEIYKREGAALRERLIKLGPTFIKIGQTLATRADLLPIEYIEELSRLQDEVPPFPAEEAKSIIERELGNTITEVFRQFEAEPIAAASLGQVHRASLLDGREVVIKVQRPHLAEYVDLDLRVLARIAHHLNRFPNLIRGVDWNGALGEFRSTIFEEMDYAREAANAEVFRMNFASWPEVYVPQIHHELSSSYMIVMEYIPGLKVTDTMELRAAHRDPREIVRLLVRTYLKQLLEDGFYHADPHPGNLRVMDDGRLAFFDFGMVGRIEAQLQSKLINAFFHTIERDVSGLVDDMVKLGFIVLTPEEEIRFKPTIEKLMDRYLNLKLREVQFKELIFDVANVVYEYPFHIPAEFTYIIRAIMTLEGIGSIVDPDFNFFEVARPYAKRFMFKREGRYLRSLIMDSLIRGDRGRIDWGKVWKLARMAIKYYWQGENKL